ncbi:homing endonuclease [Proteus phage vB_PmiM_Pm5461]|uniref:Homing endonuclease n=1 Tax=Proteus phage vB_PmiM_Pm5461 TaxID=1636250 RepID=A0A0G2SS40_9CAUD|nr:homing endonuclease [Proteus phage vB_PmiM_Pm5461]AKA61894.1 homing endonuclease [Proteus phage vB_PmiM_Pm5461]
MNFVYKVIFNNRIKNKTMPYYYIGSKTNASYVNNKIICSDGKEYYGSSKYKNYYDFIDDSVEVVILEKYETITHSELLKIESKYQKEVKAKTNPEYFNLDYACSHNSYCNSKYATYKHIKTGKCIRLERNHPLVKSGEYVGVTYGKKLSNCHKSNISKSVSGENNGFYGKTHSKETINRISEKAKQRLKNSHPRQKPVIINGVKYRGVRPASRILNINPNTIISKIKRGCEGWSYDILPQ